MPFELSWRPGGSVGFLINLFGFFELTMVVVRGREVFIRLGIAKATSMAIERIILITDSLGSARQAVNPSVHSGQAHSLAVCSALRLFFSQGHGYRIDFWDCSSKAEWSLHQLVHNDVTNTRVSAGSHPATFINFLCSKSVISCLDPVSIWPLSGGNMMTYLCKLP